MGIRARDPWGRVVTTEDFRRRARRRTPRSVFDYVEGPAERELPETRAVAAFEQLAFHPRVLRDVSSVDPGTTIPGRAASFPVVFGPTGFTRMMHAAGEPAVGRSGGRADIQMLGVTRTADLTAELVELNSGRHSRQGDTSVV